MRERYKSKNLRYALGDTGDDNNRGCDSTVDNRDVFVVIGGRTYDISHVMTTSSLVEGRYGDRKGIAIFAEECKETQQ